MIKFFFENRRNLLFKKVGELHKDDQDIKLNSKQKKYFFAIYILEIIEKYYYKIR